MQNLIYRLKLRKKNIYIQGKCLIYINKQSKIINSGLVKFNIRAFTSKDKSYEVGRLSLEKGTITIIGKNVRFYAGMNVRCIENSKLIIGDNTFFNLNSQIVCKSQITIGANCAIGENVVIRDFDNHTIVEQINNKPIEIGNNVWIGTNCIILKGVKIGDGSVIGAGSVVTHNIPPNCIAAGNPAKVIKENIKWHL